MGIDSAWMRYILALGMELSLNDRNGLHVTST